MPGIGMGDRYSWSEPPTFNGGPGEYDYMSGASSYKPASIETVKNDMNDILDSTYSNIKNYINNMFFTADLPNLNWCWNTLFSINDEEQTLLKFEEISDLGDEIQNGFEEIESTVTSYFNDAESAIGNINNSLDILEENAEKVAAATANQYNEDTIISNSAKTYLENVNKYGKQYTKADLSSIGKWVY